MAVDTVLSITAANVLPGTSADFRTGTLGPGCTATAGQPLYIDTANANTLQLALNSGTALQANVCGIALCGGGPGQRIFYDASDPALVLGCTMTVGDVIYLGSTAGVLTKASIDLDTNEYVTILGVCTVANSTIKLSPIVTGAVRTTDQV